MRAACRRGPSGFSALARLGFLAGLSVFFLLFFSAAASAAVITFTAQDKGTVLNRDFTILRDASGAMDIDAVVAASARFRPGNWSDFTPGYTRDVVWLRFEFYNPLPDDGDRYLEISPPRLQDLRLYQRQVNGSWQVLQSGTVVPVAERLVPSRLSVFPLRLLPGERRVLYVRIGSANAIMLHARLWDREDFHFAERRLDLVNGLQYGAIMLLAFYGLVLFFTTREPAVLYFVVMVAGAGFNDSSILQYGYQYFWPHAPDWNLRSPGVFGAVVVLGASLLIMRLTQLHESFPRSYRFMVAINLLLFLTMPAMVWLDYRQMAVLSFAISLMAVVFNGVLGIWAAVKRIPGALLMVQAFALTWLLSLLRLGQIFGFLPHDILIDYSQNWAMLLTGSLVVIIIMDMLRKLRLEREEAEHKAVEARMQAEQDVLLHTRELRMAKELAEANSHAKSAFLAQLSHELRTPLHSILGYSGLILSESASASDRRRVAAVQQSGRHLLALIDELLDYARLEANKLALEPRPVYLHALLDATVQEVRQLAQAQNITLSLQVAPAVPSVVMLDPLRLRQVLLNLLVNACRHSQATHISLEASCRDCQLQQLCRLRLTIRDNGIGIAPEDRARLFLPFEQGGARREGMGLGLAISHQFVQLMGGELVCDEAPGGGSLFHFTLPLEEAPESQVQPLQGEVMPRRYRGAVRRVLIVDDIAENRALLADVLATLGFDLALAESGEVALAALASGPFDLVITDQLMPDISGWDLLRHARGAGHSMPFILLSGAAPVLPDGWSPHLVFAVILMKPAEPARLAEALASVLKLEWVGDDAAEEGAALLAPPADSLLLLQEAAQQGRISDIEDWVEQLLATQPQYQAFGLAVREAVRRLDLPGILRLATP